MEIRAESVNKHSGKTRWNRFSLRRKTRVSYVKQEPRSRSQFDPWARLTVRIPVQLTREHAGKGDTDIQAKSDISQSGILFSREE